MTTGSEDLHVLLGAYVLGGLSDEDHSTFSEHLRTCGRCQAELGQVSGLPRLLDLAGPRGGPHLDEDLDGEVGDRMGAVDDSDPDERNVARLVDEVGRRRRRRRGVFSGVAAAAAVATFAIGASVGTQLLAPPTAAPTAPTSTTAPGGTASTPGSDSPVAHVAVRPVAGSAVQVDVALVARGWGTQLDIRCEDMPTSGELALWVIDRNGRAMTAASWRGTPAGYSRVTGATALSASEIRSLEVRTGTGKVLAAART